MKIAVLPARGGSRRIPRKNIKSFHGKPIMAYSIETLLETDIFDHVIVSTDDLEIASIARQYGASTIERPPEFAQDECGTQEVVRHVVETMRFPDEALVCCMYATAPLVHPVDINIAASMLMLRPATYVVAVGAQPLRDAGAFYFGTANAYLARIPLWSLHSAVYVLPEERVCDINTERDFTEALGKYERLRA